MLIDVVVFVCLLSDVLYDVFDVCVVLCVCVVDVFEWLCVMCGVFEMMLVNLDFG